MEAVAKRRRKRPRADISEAAPEAPAERGGEAGHSFKRLYRRLEAAASGLSRGGGYFWAFVCLAIFRELKLS